MTYWPIVKVVADGARLAPRNDGLHVEVFQRVDVGLVVDELRRDLVTGLAVPTQQQELAGA